MSMDPYVLIVDPKDIDENWVLAESFHRIITGFGSCSQLLLVKYNFVLWGFFVTVSQLDFIQAPISPALLLLLSAL